MIYLASPYTADDGERNPEKMEERYLAALDATAWLLRNHIWTFSPIVHCHEIAKRHDLPKSHDFWLDYDCAILARCSALYILKLDDWDRSQGVKMEIDFAYKQGINRFFLIPNTLPPHYLIRPF